jgi:hypothetical protein
MSHRKGQPHKQTPQAFRLVKRDTCCTWCLAANLPLTWDHVPPRTCGNSSFVRVDRLFSDVLAVPQATAKSRNGIKYATLCGGCNTKLEKYDEALGEFCKGIIGGLATVEALDRNIAVAIRPGAVVRSVLGHMLAAKLDSDNVGYDQMIRAYLDGNPLNGTLGLYFWFFPYHLTVVARDFTFTNPMHLWSVGLASVLKFFPLAFMMTMGSGDVPFDSPHQYAAYDVDEKMDISLNLELYMPPFWPERPHRMHAVTGGAAFFDAICSIDGKFARRLPR